MPYTWSQWFSITTEEESMTTNISFMTLKPKPHGRHGQVLLPSWNGAWPHRITFAVVFPCRGFGSRKLLRLLLFTCQKLSWVGSCPEAPVVVWVPGPDMFIYLNVCFPVDKLFRKGKCGFIKGGMSLRVGFEVSKCSTQPSLSVPTFSLDVGVSACQPAWHLQVGYKRLATTPAPYLPVSMLPATMIRC